MMLFNSVRRTWHTDALELPDLVQTGGFIQARVGQTLIDVQLTARPHVALQALALERAFGVETLSCVFTRVGTCNEGITHFY